MSRVATPPAGQPVNTQSRITQEQIAKRAYEKWVKRGRPHGSDMQDWMEAEAELRAEVRPGSTSSRR